MLHCEFFQKTRARIPAKLFLPLLDKAEKRLVESKKIHTAKAFHFEVTFVGDVFMRKLNLTYHKKNCSTDVISLSYFDPKMSDSYIGEIFICVPFAKKQAKKIGQPLTEELKFLFIHGLLHLFGYDHKKPREEAHMLSLTYSILGRKQEKIL